MRLSRWKKERKKVGSLIDSRHSHPVELNVLEDEEVVSGSELLPVR